uniref:START domain-containing protein n=1 Tax=Parastrongyloides trichosuri TaxID=131310 RepID=A0A0N4Z6X7_PARTI
MTIKNVEQLIDNKNDSGVVMLKDTNNGNLKEKSNNDFISIINRVKSCIKETSLKVFNWKFKGNKKTIGARGLMSQDKDIKLLELDEAGNVFVENYAKKLIDLRRNEMVNCSLFGEEKTARYLKEFLRIHKAIPRSNIVYEIEKCFRRGEQITFTEAPQLYNDNEILLYCDLIQPSCPDVSYNFKLGDYVGDFMESSSIEAQNALKNSDIEFKSFWSSFLCLFLTLFNYQTETIIPMMAYEYGKTFFFHICLTQFFFIFPLMLFSMRLSQYSGLDSTQVFSRIKRVWRSFEYISLFKTIYSIVVLVKEIQLLVQSLYTYTVRHMSHGKNFIESCLHFEDGCVNIGFIHPCSTGFQLSMNNNEYCRVINQVSMDKYMYKKSYIKEISLAQYLQDLTSKSFMDKNIYEATTIPLISIVITVTLLYFGKTRCTIPIFIFTLPILCSIGFITITSHNSDYDKEISRYNDLQNSQTNRSFLLAMALSINRALSVRIKKFMGELELIQ